jgi:hypothetical protein
MFRQISKLTILYFVILLFNNTTQGKLEDTCKKASEQMLAQLDRIVVVEENLLGRGGFGAVYKFQGEALKIVRIDVNQTRKLNAFVEETIFSKEVSDADSENEHVPNFTDCFIIGTEVSSAISNIFDGKQKETVTPDEEIDKPDAKLAGMSLSDIKNLANKNSSQSVTYTYIAILMEKLGKELYQIVENNFQFMDLFDRSSLFQSLAFHLQFINEQLNLNHCDVKMQNFLLTLLDNSSEHPRYPSTIMSLMGEHAQVYKSKVIDFGGVVTKGKWCTTYTIGFVPFDSILSNGSSLLKKVNSDKNDVFALGTIIAHLMSRGTKVDVLAINMVFHMMVNSMFALENDTYLKDIEQNGDQLNGYIQQLGSSNVRSVYIQPLSNKLVQLFGKFKPIFIAKWLQLSGSESISEEDFMFQVFSNLSNFQILIQSIYEDQLILFRSERLRNAQLEIIRLIVSLGLNSSNFPEFNSSIAKYVELDKKFSELVISTLSFDRNARPEWDNLQGSIAEIKVEIDELYQKIHQTAQEKAPGKKLVPNYQLFASFMENIKSGKIKLAQKSTSHKLRILTKSSSDEETSNKLEEIKKQSNLINEVLADKENQLGMNRSQIAAQTHQYIDLNLANIDKQTIVQIKTNLRLI